MVYISFGIFAVFWITGAILTESSNFKQKFAGWICTIIGAVMAIVTLALAFEARNERIKENSSEVIIVEIPPNFEGGFLRTNDGRIVYVSWSKEKSSNEES